MTEHTILYKIWTEAKKWKEIGLTFFAVTWLTQNVLIPLAKFVISLLSG